jgi:hypothetical protein
MYFEVFVNIELFQDPRADHIGRREVLACSASDVSKSVQPEDQSTRWMCQPRKLF